MTEWRDLKTLQDIAEAQANGDEIEYSQSNLVTEFKWRQWDGTWWNNKVDCFRARSKPKTKEVKLLAWLMSTGELRFIDCTTTFLGIATAKRVPSEDKVVEVEE